MKADELIDGIMYIIERHADNYSFDIIERDVENLVVEALKLKESEVSEEIIPDLQNIIFRNLHGVHVCTENIHITDKTAKECFEWMQSKLNKK